MIAVRLHIHSHLICPTFAYVFCVFGQTLSVFFKYSSIWLSYQVPTESLVCQQFVNKGDKGIANKTQRMLACVPLTNLVGVVCSNMRGPFPTLLNKGLTDLRSEVTKLSQPD